jgi:hypothetical protein
MMNAEPRSRMAGIIATITNFIIGSIRSLAFWLRPSLKGCYVKFPKPVWRNSGVCRLGRRRAPLPRHGLSSPLLAFRGNLMRLIGERTVTKGPG